jgi:glutamate formiminotransferase
VAKLVECVPNFSEGRNVEIINSIVAEIEKVAQVHVLDREMDKNHNRAVVTFIGEPEAVKQAAFLSCAKATELIDLNVHKGEHPRIGATDVIPFIPISEVTMAECVALAKQLGEEIADKLGIPVYLYEEAATRPERRDLGNIRKGQYELLKHEIVHNPARKPDYGPCKLHPTAGATAVGARMPLIAYNVNLGTDRLEIAKKIAKAIRNKDGGLRYVKAVGVDIKDKGYVQVSMNLVNYPRTPIFRALELIKSESRRYGVPIIGSEIVGLIPMDALIDAAEYYLQLDNFDKSQQILERKLQAIYRK